MTTTVNYLSAAEVFRELTAQWRPSAAPGAVSTGRPRCWRTPSIVLLIRLGVIA